MKGKSWRILKDLVMIFVASLIYGAGISLFLDPNNLAPAGVSSGFICLRRVVFPQPDSPQITRYSPLSMEKLISSNALVLASG